MLEPRWAGIGQSMGTAIGYLMAGRGARVVQTGTGAISLVRPAADGHRVVADFHKAGAASEVAPRAEAARAAVGRLGLHFASTKTQLKMQ